MTQTPTATIRTGHHRLQLGMTLLELLIVIALMSAVGFMAMSQVGDDMSQARYNDTKNRLELIRRAIIGDTSRTINGQPEIRGFVADMGRLPNHLAELLQQDYCSDPRYLTATDCAAHSGTWTEQNADALDTTLGLRAGWNGPYLIASVETDGASVTKVFRDGWGNRDGADTSTADFGWYFRVDSTDLTVTVQSYGLDNARGLQTGNEYERDYPPSGPLLVPADYQTEVTDLPVDFGITTTVASGHCDGTTVPTSKAACEAIGGTWDGTTCTLDLGTQATCAAASGVWTGSLKLCARIFTPINGRFPTDAASAETSDELDATVVAGTPLSGSFHFSTPITVTQGVRAIGIYTFSGGTCETTLYPARLTAPRPHTFVARVPLQPIPWPQN